MSDSDNDPSQASTRSCDLLVRNAFILTMDGERREYPTGAVAIDGRNIVGVGPVSEIVPRYQPRRVIDAGGGLVHPGVFELHYHATMHMVSRLAPEKPATSEDAGAWGARQFTGLINALDEEAEYASALLAGLDMLRSGITMFVDPGTAHEPETIASAAIGLGMRASVAEPWLMDRRGPNLADIDGAPLDHRRCMDLLGNQLWRNEAPEALVRGHVALYGVGSHSDELAIAAKACADEHGAPFNIHQSQAVDDAQFDDERYGRHPMVHYADIGILDQNSIFVHLNVLREDEIEPIIDSGMSIVWSPTNSWFYGTRQHAPNRLPELFRRGVNLTIGTDVGKASAFGDQLFMAYIIARDQGDYLSPGELLQMQTINGAKSLGLADRLGSLEPGKRADLVIRTNDLPEARPCVNVERQHLLLARARSIDTVIVDGRIVVKGGRSTLMDENVIYDQAQKAAERMLARVGR